MITDGNLTYSGDHFTAYTNIKSWYCTPEADIMSIISQLKNYVETVYLDSVLSFKIYSNMSNILDMPYIKPMFRIFFSKMEKIISVLYPGNLRSNKRLYMEL